MTPSRSISRRFFLQTLLSLHIYVLSPLARTYARKDAADLLDPLPSKLGTFFRHGKSAKAIGSEYLKIAPMESDIYLLSNLICSFNEEHRTELLYADSRRFRELLRRRVCVDFEQDRIVKVHGWILALTEARLCALSALL
jgi:hypothetical protein